MISLAAVTADSIEEFVRVEHRDSVAVVRIDRPKANALSIVLLEQLVAALEKLGASPPGALVIWGGERIFAAGAEIGELADPVAAPQLLSGFRRAFDTLARFPRASIAAIAGFALGGGLELALACDFRICLAGAKLGQPEVELGLIPGAGGTQRLARLVGPARAKDIVMTGRHLEAEESRSIGLVDRVVRGDDVLRPALELAQQLASGPVVAHGLAKEAIDKGLELPLADALTLERALFDRALATEDARRGIESFLRDGPGRARFTGR